MLIFALGPRTFRAVTHLDVTAEQCAAAADILVDAASPDGSRTEAVRQRYRRLAVRAAA